MLVKFKLQYTLLIIFCLFVDDFTRADIKDGIFCLLQGKVEGCQCDISTIDNFNNVHIHPRLKSLLSKDYFRYYKINLNQPCLFWDNKDERCFIKYCTVKSCHYDDIPLGLKVDETFLDFSSNCTCKKFDRSQQLSYLNKTISDKTAKDISLWTRHDDSKSDFCFIDENDSEAEYVDLAINPERFTGYRGHSAAHKIWNSIYKENCFRPRSSNIYVDSKYLKKSCLEERLFYKLISGLHASINVHVCGEYPLSKSPDDILVSRGDQWGPNLKEFHAKFSPETTQREGPKWLKNMYFLYLLELRALSKATPYLLEEEFYTGKKTEDTDTRLAILDLLRVIQMFPHHFSEKGLFKDDTQHENAKNEFALHFKNVTKIMDCVGCDKCKLWGKLQVQGLGTAMKILFTGRPDDDVAPNQNKKNFQLKRTEIVALFNSLGRLSASIHNLETFKKIKKEEMRMKCRST